MPLLSSEAIPLYSFRIVLGYTLAIVVHKTKVQLSVGIPLLSSKAIPLHGFSIVLRNTLAFGVHDTQIVLSVGIPLLSSKAIPLHGFSIVLRNTLAIVVHDTQIVLSTRMPLLSSEAIPLYSLNIVLRNAHTTFIHATQVVLSTRVPLLGQFSELNCRQRIISIVKCSARFIKSKRAICISFSTYYESETDQQNSHREPLSNTNHRLFLLIYLKKPRVSKLFTVWKHDVLALGWLRGSCCALLFIVGK